ncbi:restriction endonuclease subunit S [Thermoanaerobacterium thermosaccharolyticum]|uniref:restriction endonuclease subunit S n=1 Tax=Thermoanaerobacterium thermosaccharolyticum TaxID=1517 RepID=UPI003D29655D
MYFEYIHSEIIDDRIDAQFFTPEYIKSLKKINQFRIETLGNISRRIFDPPHTAPEFVDKSDFEMIMIENITLNGIEGNFRAISETCHKDIFKNSHLEGNELLVSRVGNSSGTFASVFPCYKGKNVSGNISIIKLKDEIIDKEYAFAYFNSNIGQNSIKRNIANTARKFLTISKIREFQVPIPSPEIQKYIGDKVRKAEELREEAKRLKKEAEEILNKELNLKDVEFYIKQTNNKKYSWTESIEIEDRIDSEFYKPKYRYLSKLNNMSELSYYYKISKKRINKNIDRKIKYIDLSSVNNIIEPSDFNTKELPSRAQFLVKEGNLIISTLKGSNKISIIPEHLNDSVCSTGFIVIASKSHLTTEYLYLVFSNKVFNMQIERYSTGSIMSGVNHDNFNKMLIPVISNKQIIDTITNKIRKHFRLLYYSKQLIQEAKQDVEDLIEGNFDMSKVKANS